MWYIGYINFDKLTLKSAFDNKVFNKLIPKSININKSKIENIFSKRNFKIFFSLLLLFIPLVNLIYAIVIYKKYKRWLKNEIISQTKLNKVLTLILIFTFTGSFIYQYSYEPQLLLGIPAGILLYYHMPRIFAYTLLNRLLISDFTKTYNQTLTIIMLLIIAPVFLLMTVIILSAFSIPSTHYWLFAGILFLYAGLYALYSFRKNSNSLIINQSILQKLTFNLDSMNRFFKLSFILFVLIIAWDIIANFNNFNAVFIIVFILFIVISLLLGFIVQLFKTKWTLIGTTNNWLIAWCISVCINIIILFLFKP
tara:strand:- start:37 stop:966 length:930 start_codon:yes stop_codon:yes gene_type:complete